VFRERRKEGGNGGKKRGKINARSQSLSSYSSCCTLRVAWARAHGHVCDAGGSNDWSASLLQIAQQVKEKWKRMQFRKVVSRLCRVADAHKQRVRGKASVGTLCGIPL
jgi:hypothetical protein